LTIRTLVLLGAGHAHLHVIRALKQSMPAALDVKLVSPYANAIYSGMLPGHIAGHYALEELSIALEALVNTHAGPSGTATGNRISWLHTHAQTLDAQERIIMLANGDRLPYDFLSINTGSAMEKERIDALIPGAREHAIFVRPIEQFVQLWPRVLEHAATQAQQISVIGAGATGIELALALQHRLPHCRVTLVAGTAPPAQRYGLAVQQRVATALARANITVLQAQCQRIEAGRITLDNGASLSCDMPLLAVGGHAPGWLQGSGLQLTDSGHVAVNSFQQSVSHANVFAAGDVALQANAALRNGDSNGASASKGKAGVYAMRTGPTLAHNLLASFHAQALKAHPETSRPLNLISLGARRCIMSWGAWSAQGGWAWRYKDVRDRRWVRQYQIHE
jgi:NADH dehydrogenase FAD-containing subunit